MIDADLQIPLTWTGVTKRPFNHEFFCRLGGAVSSDEHSPTEILIGDIMIVSAQVKRLLLIVMTTFLMARCSDLLPVACPFLAIGFENHSISFAFQQI